MRASSNAVAPSHTADLHLLRSLATSSQQHQLYNGPLWDHLGLIITSLIISNWLCLRPPAPEEIKLFSNDLLTPSNLILMMNGIYWNESYMNCGYEIKWSYDIRSYERNFCNCVEKPEKFRTSTGFESVTSRFRCVALTNWAMKPLTLGTGHLWVLMIP